MRHLWMIGVLAALAGGFLAGSATAESLKEHARQYDTLLGSKILPYWHDTAQDSRFGGYLLADDLKGRGQAREKQLVGQARMVWGFSHAHLRGYNDVTRNYLKAAEQGFRFLTNRFLDKIHGGYYWRTSLEGNATDPRKIVYGQSFVIYAFVEYYRASGNRAAVDHAMALYRVLQQRAHDAKHGGWVEHFERDWTPLPPRAPNAEVEVAGYKSANTHLHLMEAFTELYRETRDPQVKRSLVESLRINKRYFYPPQPGQSAFHRLPDWSPVTDPRSAGLSYGHNVEFAWLMVQAEKALSQRPSWSHFLAHINHALEYGYDHQRGGLYALGAGNQPASNRDKVWWVQSEMMAALAESLRYKPHPAHEAALEKLIHFINQYQADPKDGIWLDTVTEDGRPKSTGKAHSWKANYHDVRALVKFVDAFQPGRPHLP